MFSKTWLEFSDKFDNTSETCSGCHCGKPYWGRLASIPKHSASNHSSPIVAYPFGAGSFHHATGLSQLTCSWYSDFSIKIRTSVWTIL